MVAAQTTEGDTMSATATTEAPGTAPAVSPAAIRWLRVDALVSGAFGLLLAAAAPFVDGLLGAPVGFLIPLGVFLLGYAGVLVLLARRGAPARAVKAVVAGNALWVAASVGVVLADLLTLSTTGTIVALFQAAAVALLAGLQLRSVRTTSAR
jgi:vacuolar-type H+-ATPase subunit I/STV1